MANLPDPASRVAVVIVVFALNAVAFWMLQPLTTLLLSQRGVDSATIGMVASTPWIGVLLVSPILPTLVTRVGYVGTLRLGIVAGVVAALGLWYFQNILLWSMANMLLGVAVGLRWIVCDSWIAGGTSEATRGRVVGVYESIAGACIGAGPLALSFVVELGRHCYLIAAALGLMSLAPLVRAVPPGHAGSVVNRWQDWLAIFRHQPQLIGYAFLCGLIETGLVAVLPLHALDAGWSSASAARLLTALGVGAIAAQVPIGALADRYGARLVGYGCGAVLIGCLLGIALLPATGAWIWWVVGLLGSAIGGLYTIAMIHAGGDENRSELLHLIAGLATAYTVGSVIGPIAAGVAMEQWPPAGFAYLFVVLLIAVFALTAGRMRDRHVGAE